MLPSVCDFRGTIERSTESRSRGPALNAGSASRRLPSFPAFAGSAAADSRHRPELEPLGRLRTSALAGGAAEAAAEASAPASLLSLGCARGTANEVEQDRGQDQEQDSSDHELRAEQHVTPASRADTEAAQAGLAR